MTDDFGPSERDLTIVGAASLLAQHISKALRAGRERRHFDEAERTAILREAFDCTVGAIPHDGTGDPHA
jgi:hypothetical protein